MVSPVTIKRILCPIDFSEYSRRAINRAVALAGEVSAPSRRCTSSPRRCPPVRRPASPLPTHRVHARRFEQFRTTPASSWSSKTMTPN